jgi:DNA mismatch endonuclease (patch repair protein)
MADVHSKEVRSYNMSRIKGKNTKPEIMVRRFLFSHGYRFRLNVVKLPGKPDIVLSRFKTVVFINGCFWHGHEGCKYFVIPKTRTEWWMEKISKNKEKDNENIKRLKETNWTVITVFECSLRTVDRETTLHKLLTDIKNSEDTNS